MQDASMAQKMWAEAMNIAVYLKNRSPHKAVIGKTPEELWNGKKVKSFT